MWWKYRDRSLVLGGRLAEALGSKQRMALVNERVRRRLTHAPRKYHDLSICYAHRR
jgi:hypothetical protein